MSITRNITHKIMAIKNGNCARLGISSSDMKAPQDPGKKLENSRVKYFILCEFNIFYFPERNLIYFAVK